MLCSRFLNMFEAMFPHYKTEHFPSQWKLDWQNWIWILNVVHRSGKQGFSLSSYWSTWRIQNHYVSGIRPSSGILNTIKHNVSETGLLPSSDAGRETPTLLGPLERANLNHWITGLVNYWDVYVSGNISTSIRDALIYFHSLEQAVA
jgi:hypothetical protein